MLLALSVAVVGGGYCFCLTTHSDIPIPRQVIQIVSFYK